MSADYRLISISTNLRLAPSELALAMHIFVKTLILNFCDFSHKNFVLGLPYLFVSHTLFYTLF